MCLLSEESPSYTPLYKFEDGKKRGELNKLGFRKPVFTILPPSDGFSIGSIYIQDEDEAIVLAKLLKPKIKKKKSSKSKKLGPIRIKQDRRSRTLNDIVDDGIFSDIGENSVLGQEPYDEEDKSINNEEDEDIVDVFF